MQSRRNLIVWKANAGIKDGAVVGKIAAKSAVAHAEKFKELHTYYTIWVEDPLKKMQSLIMIACKLLRIIYMILKKGTVEVPKKMLMYIRRPEKKEVVQRKTFWQHYLFQSLAEFQMILKLGGVLERNSTTMECDRYCISTMTSETRQGKRPRKNRTLWKQPVSKNQNKNKSCSLQ